MAGDFSDLKSFPAEWPQLRLGDFAAVKGGKRLPLGTALVTTRTAHPYLRIVDFKDGGIDKSALMFVPDDVFPSIARYTISSRDVYISIVGTVGLVGVVDQELDGANLTENAAKICDIAAQVTRDYLCAFLRSGWGQHQIRTLTVGSTQPKLALFRIADIRVPLPPLHEQRAITHILGTLDNKIELNRRMNSTLEEMARALFKSWFVHFDPVRAKMEGRDTGLPAEVADLFPDGFEESALGEVPRGWKVGSYLEVADLLSGGTPSTSVAEYWNGDIPWVSAKDVSGAAGSFLLQTEKTISQLGVDNSSTKVLPAFTTIITARGTVGSYCLLGREMAMNQTNYGLRAKPSVGDYFVFFSTAEMIKHLRQQAYGTIFDTITTKTFRDTVTVQPPQPLLVRFEDVSGPIMARVLSNEQQSRTLAALRDALLPKLISGEVRVGDATRFGKGGN